MREKRRPEGAAGGDASDAPQTTPQVSCGVFLTQYNNTPRDVADLLRRLHATDKKSIVQWQALVREYGGTP